MDSKILRKKEKSILFGLCSGFESCFGISRLTLRILFVLLTLVGGFGVILYLMLSLFTEKKTSPKRFLGVFSWYSKKYNLEITKFRLIGGMTLFLMAHYGLTIYLLAFLWMTVKKFSEEKNLPSDNSQD